MDQEMGALTGFLFSGIGLLLIAAVIIVQILFLLSMYRAMNKVPENKHYFPSWFVWMMIVPIAHFVFAWMMLPWGIPRTFRSAVEGNPEAVRRADNLFSLGLANVILLTVSLIPILGLFTFLASIVVWIIYWVKAVHFRRDYLDVVQVPTPKEM